MPEHFLKMGQKSPPSVGEDSDVVMPPETHLSKGTSAPPLP